MPPTADRCLQPTRLYQPPRVFFRFCLEPALSAIPDSYECKSCKTAAAAGLTDVAEIVAWKRARNAGDDATVKVGFDVGDRVDGNYAAGVWYPATIARVHQDGGFTVDWDDNDQFKRRRKCEQTRRVPCCDMRCCAFFSFES